MPPEQTHVTRAGLRLAATLADFVEKEVLPGLNLEPNDWWARVSELVHGFADDNQRLLDERDRLQREIDNYLRTHRAAGFDPAHYADFLARIGYLAPDPGRFEIATTHLDEEVSKVAGPQLVVPALNQRFALNAANARWGSLYDALYGTDAIAPPPANTNAYDKARGAHVIAWAKRFLDDVAPLESGSHADVTGWRVIGTELTPRLQDPSMFLGYRGDPREPTALLLRHNGLHIELHLDHNHAVGREDPAGLADVVLESALTTIVDLEDSIAAVDAEDKTNAYRAWLGLIKGDLSTQFEKSGRVLSRGLSPDRIWTAPDGSELTARGRSLLFVRNVGCHMHTNAVVLTDGRPAPEGIVDAILTSAIAMYDLRGLGRYRNSVTGAIYIVKPKLHGPDEAQFANRLFAAVEALLGLELNTIKIGLMDEERRTSCNLAACIHALRDRIFFINTGFLDRTGDEIHTSMQAGPLLTKAAMKSAEWIEAYEKRNVSVGLQCGFAGRAQIGKGMWAAPDRMAEMLSQKSSHPAAGATTAWVPSPTAATLHATHYHRINVGVAQVQAARQQTEGLDRLLSIPLMANQERPTAQQLERELDNNTQGILGYVVRWIDHGVGCSKVPNIDNVGLMEDRATLRISSQQLANWLLHKLCNASDIDASLLRMARRVDEQNRNDLDYRPLSSDAPNNLAFQAARALIFEGVSQPNGYTEPVLHAFRARLKARAAN